jgi:hypothetical protein
MTSQLLDDLIKDESSTIEIAAASEEPSGCDKEQLTKPVP